MPLKESLLQIEAEGGNEEFDPYLSEKHRNQRFI